jgi:hypothetical protein
MTLSELSVPKCNLGVIEKAMLQGVDWSSDHIFCLLTVKKCDVGESEKGLFQGVA